MKKLIASALLVLAIILCACGNATEVNEGAYTLYYTNETATTMVPYYYQPTSKDAVSLARELYEEMAKVKESNAVSVIPSEVNLANAELSDSVLDLYVDGDVSELTKSQRLVFFAAITKSMNLIEGVDGIRVFYNGVIVSSAEGEEGGILRDDSFVNNVSDVEDYVETEVVLYFADADKDSLVKTKKTVKYRSTTAIERVVLEELIEGPDSGECNKTLSSGISILGLSTRDGVCYVNLDDKFISDPVTSFDQVPVYSIVNSLTELPGIDSVQITVNGSKDVTMPMGTISLSSPFTFNNEIVTQ